jgi:hypothetical protein
MPAASPNGDTNPLRIRHRVKIAVLMVGAAGIEIIFMSGADDR